MRRHSVEEMTPPPRFSPALALSLSWPAGGATARPPPPATLGQVCFDPKWVLPLGMPILYQ